MTDVYKIGVSVVLGNLVSAELLKIGEQFGLVNKKVLGLNASMALLAIGGIAAIGFALKGAIKSSSEYAHQLNIMNMAGLSQVEIANAVGAAWKNSSTVMTTTATDNLKVLLDLRNVLGSMPEAMAMLPTVTKIQAVMSSSSEGKIRDNADSIAFGMAKALDTIGAVTPEKMQHEAEMMSKVVTAFQGRVQPNQFQSVFTYARQAKFDMSDEFKYEILPSLMLEMSQGHGGAGGGSRGVGPMLAAFYRVTNQGYINKKSLGAWKELGYVDASSALKTTTTATTVGAMKNAGLAAANPFQWVEGLVEAIHKKYGPLSDQDMRAKLNELFRGNQLAASLAVEFFTKKSNYLRDQKIIKGAMGYTEAFDTAEKNDPYMGLKEMESQWENVKIAFGTNFQPVVVPTLHFIAEFFNYMGNVFRGMGEVYSRARNAISGTWDLLSSMHGVFGSSSATPPSVSGPTVVIEHTTNLDGAVLAKSVTQYQIDGMAKAPASGNDFDLRASPFMPGYSAARGY